LLAGCSGAEQPQKDTEERSIDIFAMDTYMTVRAYGASEELLSDAAELVYGLEARLSATREGSEIYELDHTGAARLSEDTTILLERAMELCRATSGALDITVYPVVKAWGFTTEAYRVPSQEEIDALLERVDYTRLVLEGEQAALPEGMEADLGSLAKGYTGDLLCSLLRAGGVESALLDLGGNIQALGSKPDGSDWRIAIQDPTGEGRLGVLRMADKAVITSGGYERYFVDEEGQLWWHIMDPATGYPARNGLISVTIVASEGLYADALSTALFVMGPERAIDFWRGAGDFEMALVTEDGKLLMTPDLASSFTPAEDLAYEMTVIEN